MLNTRRTFEVEYGLAEADAVLIGVPFSSTEIGRPVSAGPVLIREALKGLEGFDPETGRNPFAELKLADAGDVAVVPGSWELTAAAIADVLSELAAANPRALPVLLGGEHLATLAAVGSLVQRHGRLTVVHFDAHRDLLDEWMGNKHSHVTWARRALELPGVTLVQLGCRCGKPEEAAFAKSVGVREGLAGLSGPVYVTVDIDVLDPALAPEVGTPEPAGWSMEQLLSSLRSVFAQAEVVGLDVMECAADRLHSLTALACAHAVKKAFCYWMERRGP